MKQLTSVGSTRLASCTSFHQWKACNDDGSISCPPTEFGGCGDGHLDLRCVFPSSWTKQLEISAEEIVCSYEFPEILDVSSPCSLCIGMDHEIGKIKELQEAANREDSNDNFLYYPTVQGLHDDNLEHFQKHWGRGHPIIVRNVLQGMSDLSWDPIVMFCTYLERSSAKSENDKKAVKATSCLDWCETWLGSGGQATILVDPVVISLLIGFWDAKERDCGLSSKESEARRNAVEDFSKWASMEGTSWRQKSRELWLKEVDGRKLTKEAEIKERVVNAFQNILSESGNWRPSILDCLFLSSLKGDKTPRPDESLNSTYIILIPKKGGIDDLKDFRPISLVVSLCKLLAKVLANKLKRVVGKVISNSQYAFTEKLKGWIICKRDMEKAYDYVNWGFLLAIMEKRKFGAKWGLRQGDHLSLFLFILAMEAFSCILKRDSQGGFLEGFLASRKGGELKVGNDSKGLSLEGRRVIVGKYGEEEGGWCSGPSKEGYGVGLWKAIKNGWMEFSKRVAFRLWNGRRVCFWKDRWCGDDSLEEAFPSLYSLASSKDA
ncbi:hypothetical protein AAG906_028489 [Vitis piasezkii]